MITFIPSVASVINFKDEVLKMKRKILIFSIVLILVSVAITSMISINAMIENFEEDNKAELENYADLINKALEEDFANGITPNYAVYAVHFGEEISERVTFIDSDGNVLGDSYKGETYVTMENHKYREEIKKALQGEVGVSIRDSGTLQKKFVYVAVPLLYQNHIPVITRIAMEIDQVEIINDFIIRNSVQSAAIGIIIAILLSLIYTGRLIKPVSTILRATSRIAEGHYDERIFIKTGDELESIAVKINDTAEKLGQTFKELTDGNSKMRSVLFSMKEALIAVDNEFNVILTNNAAKEMFGLEEADMGEYLLRAVRNSQLYNAFKKVVDEKYIGSQEIEFANDRIYKIKTVSISNQANGQQLGIMALIEDVTDYKKMENIRKDFVANVSHELKTPLTSIAGFVETLQSGAAEDPVTRAKFLDIISIESARLKRLIEDILIISDIERGRELRTEDKFDIKGAIDQTIRSIDPIISEKQAKVTTDYDPGELIISGNPDRFKQMMVNLIENAVKYSGPGAEVLISVHRKYNRIHISVKDNGFGIPAEHLPRLFERFYRVDRSRSQKEGGTGLGLAIVKHIVNLFEGEIFVKSKVGEGTEFTIIL